VARGAGGKKRNYVGMLEPGRELDLALEPLGIDAGAHFGWEDLDDHLAFEPDLFSQEDTAHPPAAEFLADAVGVPDYACKPRQEVARRELDWGPLERDETWESYDRLPRAASQGLRGTQGGVSEIESSSGRLSRTIWRPRGGFRIVTGSLSSPNLSQERQ